MVRIAICDDDKAFAGYVESLIIKIADFMSLPIETEVYFDGASLLNGLKNGYQYELMFLDIEMEQLDGIEAARQIRKMDRSVILIYISEHEQYLKELFEVEAFRFLAKPLDEELLKCYFEDAVARIGEANLFYQYMYNKAYKKVPFDNIVYFESDYRKIHIILDDGTEDSFYGKMNDVEEEIKAMNQCFIRIHQSYLVNYKYIKRMDFTYATISMNGGNELDLKISEERQKEVRRKLSMYNDK